MDLPSKCKRVNLICGHYGSGKTNLAVNLALNLLREGKAVTLVDLDIVNPYFRSADFTEGLEALGVRVVSPAFANTNLDIPALTAQITGVFQREDGVAILDIGGDDAGAAAVGRYARMIPPEDYQFWYVVSRYRYLTREPQEAAGILKEIELAAHIKATGIINNSNLGKDTDAQTVLNALDYGQAVAGLTELPLVAVSYPQNLQCQLGSVSNGYPVEVYVRPPWEKRPLMELSH